MQNIETAEEYFNDLSPLQNKAIRVLLTRGSVSQAVRSTGISRATFYRYLEDENFRAVLRHHTRAILDSTTRNLVMAAEDCVNLLTSVVNNPDAPLSLRLRAADSVMTHLVRLVALSDMESRIAAIEEIEKGGWNEHTESTIPAKETRAA